MDILKNYECEGKLSIFDIGKADYKITKPIRLIELFAGVGSQAMALRDIGANFEHYRVVEFDKYAIASYNAIHGTNFPTIDITEFHGSDLGIVNKAEYCYILTYPTSQTRRGRVIDQGNVSPTLTTENLPSVLEKWTWEIDGVTYLIRIRKLTPKECWRLMGFKDDDFHKAEAVNSNTQLYKQAGNSIVKQVLENVFSQFIDFPMNPPE